MKRILTWYTKALRENPKISNAVMTGTLFGIGDVIAQCFFPDAQAQQKKEKYDFARTARGVIYGSCIFSFIGDKWYRFLNNKIRLPNQANSSILNTACRVALDQLCFAPVGIPLYFCSMTLLEGKSLRDAQVRVQNTWWGVLTTNWVIWPAVQAVNFSLVPIYHRLLVTNLVAIFWNSYMSYKNTKLSHSFVADGTNFEK